MVTIGGKGGGAGDQHVEPRELLGVQVVDQLAQADTTDVVPMAHPLDVAQRLRPDAVTEPDDRDHFQENAPYTKDGLYLVPKVIE